MSMIETTGTRRPGKNKKIDLILATSNRLFREGIATIVKEDNSIEIVSEVSNPLEVIQSVREYSFDILLMSVDIKGLNLKKVLQMVKKKNNGKVLVIVDRQYDEDELVNAISLGLRGYVLKDANSSLLRKAIKAVHEGQLWVERSIMGKAIDVISNPQAKRKRSHSSRLYDLTDSELNIVKMVASGDSNQEIAKNLYLSEKTVKFHLYKVFKKLSLKSRSQLILHCFRNGMLR